MEYKKRLRKIQKRQKTRNRKARGLVRVKVRGRKRWIQPAKVVQE